MSEFRDWKEYGSDLEMLIDSIYLKLDVLDCLEIYSEALRELF